MSAADATGSLVLVGTPIGNLGDIPARAAQVLAAAAVVYCEDTRHSRQLLTHLGISGKRLVSLHEHNEDGRMAAVLEALAAGQTVALVSDAGMPVISDPGQRLVAAARAAGFAVSAVPGPNAAIMALAISGLPAERFAFEGFLPVKASERRARISALAGERRTAILYESPHRVAKLVAELAAACGPERQIMLTRELTKRHEEVWSGGLAAAVDYLASTPPRGEYTVVLAGAAEVVAEVTDDAIMAALVRELAGGGSRRSAVEAVAIELGVPRKRVYALSLTL